MQGGAIADMSSDSDAILAALAALKADK